MGNTQPIKFIAMPSAQAQAYRKGKKDANGIAPEQHISDGNGNPCRHCLEDIAAGEKMLAFCYRPFDSLQPYAESGPVFLHAETCKCYKENAGLADMFLKREAWLLRGYGSDDRIVAGTGATVDAAQAVQRAKELLQNEQVSYVHVRSASNNCYQCKIEQA